jgi:hypothetical protein
VSSSSCDDMRTARGTCKLCGSRAAITSFLCSPTSPRCRQHAPPLSACACTHPAVKRDRVRMRARQVGAAASDAGRCGRGAGGFRNWECATAQGKTAPSSQRYLHTLSVVSDNVVAAAELGAPLRLATSCVMGCRARYRPRPLTCTRLPRVTRTLHRVPMLCVSCHRWLL